MALKTFTTVTQRHSENLKTKLFIFGARNSSAPNDRVGNVLPFSVSLCLCGEILIFVFTTQPR